MSNVDQNNDRNNGRHEEEEDHPLLNELVQQIRRVAVENGYDPDDCIDMEKTRVILQVTEGDVTSAALLYWDDFLATSGPPPAMAANPPPLQQPAQPPGPPNEQVPAELLVASIARGRPLAQGRLRRWLEHDFRRHAAEGSGSGGNNNSNNSIHRHSDNDDDDDNNNNNQNNDADDHHHQAGEGGFARILVLARETARRQLDSTNNNNNNNRAAAAPADRQNVAGMAARAAQAYLAAAEAARHGNGHDESASVSDDESGGVWRMMGAALQHQQHVNDEDVEDHTDTSATNQSSFRKRKQRDSENNATSIDSQDYIDVVEDGYLSDNDWLWESLMPRANIPVCTPFEILWGIPPGRSSEITHASSMAGSEGVVVADEEDDIPVEQMGIPRSWLAAAFTMNEDATGLALPPPTEEDVAFFAWRQQAGSNKTNPPPPFYCGALSAILSIVTGLLYTGASLASRTITTIRKPFIELNHDERKREFETRLVDALAALLHTAAMASKLRKERALKYVKVKEWKMQKLQRKLQLCPTCWWEPGTNGDVRIGRDANTDLQVVTSYTNMEDLRDYVLSNLPAFTSRGGVVLFLETILRIHGKGAIEQMIQSSRRKAGLPHTIKSLISCKCEERHKALNIKPEQLRQRSKTRELMEAPPAERSCIPIELISLIMTGHVHSTWKDWSTGDFGLGFLTNTVGEVGRGLTRPTKPVWVICGPTQYSILCFNGGYDDPVSFAQADQPESVVELIHLGCWPGKRHATTFRLSPTFSGSIHSARKPSTLSPQPPPSKLAHILRRTNTQTPQNLHETEPINASLMSSCCLENECVEANQDDQRYYPERYRMWRYKFDGVWIPFFRLSERQKAYVESNMGPKISLVLRTRWPHAVIEGFAPDVPEPVV